MKYWSDTTIANTLQLTFVFRLDPIERKTEAKLKQIEIKCKGAGAISIDLLTPLQGNLKYLTEANYKRFRTELEVDGFIDPISVWEDKDAKVYILGGHQRYETLTRMRDEGWSIPQIPVNYVEAKDLKDAKRKILALASQYGTVTNDGVSEFIADMGMDMDDFDSQFVMPEIDLDKVLFEPMPEPEEEDKTKVSEHERSKKGEPTEDSPAVIIKCPHCNQSFDIKTASE